MKNQSLLKDKVLLNSLMDSQFDFIKSIQNIHLIKNSLILMKKHQYSLKYASIFIYLLQYLIILYQNLFFSEIFFNILNE